MALEPVKAVAFEMMTGNLIGRIPASDISWQQTLNDPGSIDITIDWSREADQWDVRAKTYPYRTLVAVMRGDHIIHAGPVTRRNLAGQKLTINAAGMWKIFEHRLVLNHALASRHVDGMVMIDEENPSPEWVLEFTGSLVDIAVQLVAESLKWGRLPITLPGLTGGANVRTYYGFDLAYISDRLKQLTEVIGGPELRFDPQIGRDGKLFFTMRGDAELIDTVHNWNVAAPGGRAMLEGIDESADSMATDYWGLGGGSDDMVLVARASSDALTRQGWPVMQSADTTHSSVSELETLQGYVAEGIVRGSVTQEVFPIRVSAEHTVRPGDWANVTIAHPYTGHTTLPLKILEVSGDTTDWMTVQTRIRNGI
ncbi:hypothetical protein [Lysinibacter sp. HNR]|uniref:hypothetical protein n=1 Tax=Lysinibacter sp. HNR TaxID=3031408 RepID=UPI0024353D9C|nr:hypothetical protein [Lysinibacter sp. HNR]WGD38470.1 hypothetical protein FrondiHNR_06055 [Lysinibacter sp. HNR]